MDRRLVTTFAFDIIMKLVVLWVMVVEATAAVCSNVTIRSVRSLDGKRTLLRCLANFMLLELDLKGIPTIQPTSLHLKRRSCKPHHVATTKAVFRVPFQGCGTTRGTINNYITFSNVVENSRVENDSSNTLNSIAPDLHVPFSCRYRRKYTVVIKEGQQREDGDKKEKEKRKSNATGGTGAVRNKASRSKEIAIYSFAGLFLLAS